MRFGRFLAILTLLASFLNACALCALYSPTAHVTITLNTVANTIKSTTINWEFSENFTELTMQSYDENADKNLSKKEAWAIQKSLLDYIVPRGYLTNISFYDGNGVSEAISQKILSQKIFLNNNRLNFEYNLELNLQIKDKRVLVFEIIDYEGYFNFKILQTNPYNITKNLFMIPNINLNTAFFEISSKKPLSENNKLTLNELIKQQNLEHIDKIDEANFNKSSLANATLGFLEKLKESIKKNKEEFRSLNFIFIVLLSFIYGLIHAAGPGHAKMLTTSYFIANGGSYKKAFMFAIKVGLMHVGGALILVATSYFLIESLAANLSKNTTSIMTKISALVVISVAIFMLLDKIKKISKKPKLRFTLPDNTSKILITNTHINNCKCSCCNNNFKNPKNLNEWLVVLSSALIPCPGIILVFTLAFSLNSYFVAFASAIFIGLGMSVIIFVAGIFGFKLRGIFGFKNLRIYIEIIGLCLMLGVGIFMFYISDRLGVL
jgi:transporter, ni2+-co2+ transporter